MWLHTLTDASLRWGCTWRPELRSLRASVAFVVFASAIYLTSPNRSYWLPSILKHEFVAIRFLPQVDYEASAPLEINPLPDVVTRVFMLFQGIPPDRLSEWQEAQERSSKDVDSWVAIVGVDGVRQRDTSLFRVLEWGGMEVF